MNVCICERDDVVECHRFSMKHLYDCMEIYGFSMENLWNYVEFYRFSMDFYGNS